MPSVAEPRRRLTLLGEIKQLLISEKRVKETLFHLLGAAGFLSSTSVTCVSLSKRAPTWCRRAKDMGQHRQEL